MSPPQKSTVKVRGRLSWHKNWRARVRCGTEWVRSDPGRSPLESAENFFWWTSVDPPRVHRVVRRTPPDSAGSASGPVAVRGGSADPPPRSSPRKKSESTKVRFAYLSPPRTFSPPRTSAADSSPREVKTAADFSGGFFFGGLYKNV